MCLHLEQISLTCLTPRCVDTLGAAWPDHADSLISWFMQCAGMEFLAVMICIRVLICTSALKSTYCIKMPLATSTQLIFLPLSTVWHPKLHI